MRAEDLFEAIGGVESFRLERSETSRIIALEERKMKHPTRRIRNLLIAAAVIAMLAVTAYAALNARIKLDTQRWKGSTAVEEVPEGTYQLELGFHPTGSDYIPLNASYPQSIPDGCHLSFVSDKTTGQQMLVYSDDQGNEAFRFLMTSGGQGHSVGLDKVEKEESVEIQGLPGTRYYQEGGLQSIAWVDEESGYGYMLIGSIPDLDLLPIAQSVAPGAPLTPTMATGYGTALNQLGDYRITALPDGFKETDFSALPLEEGDRWYAYVRRWYGNGITTDNMIYFTYEHFTLESDVQLNHPTEPVENTPDTIIAYKGGGEKTTVLGMPGAVSDTGIVWVDWDAQVVFQITAPGRSAQDMMNLALSVQKF